jgi:hypothetical protein
MKNEPITLEQKAKYYRTLAKKSLKKQEELYKVYNSNYYSADGKSGVHLLTEIRNEQKFYSKMLYEAETNELVLRLANEHRTKKK